METRIFATLVRRRPMALYKSAAMLAVLPLVLAQCAKRQVVTGPEAEGDPYMVPASGVDEPRQVAPSEERSSALNDGQIAMASDVAHNMAIEQSKIVYAKTKDPRVKEYAQTVLADHSRAQQRETAIVLELRASPEESDLSTELGIEAGKTLYALRDSGTGPIDRTYIEAQVVAQEKLLTVLDEKLIPNVSNADLKRELEAFRVRVRVHLERARELKQEFEKETEPKNLGPGTTPLP
jgi:putative membrane protein